MKPLQSVFQRMQFHWLVITPSLIFLLVIFVYPLSIFLLKSFFDPSLTAKHYLKFFGGPVYARVLLVTFKTGFSVALICLVLGYPVAYLLARAPNKVRNYLMIIILVPFWTSVLVRSYSWMVILGREGVLNHLLIGLGIIDSPLRLLHTTFAVNVGMVHMMLPFMILALFSVMKGIDLNLLKAAASLGANSFQTFLKVYLPLTLPGVAAGSLLVFIFSLGFFITPALLGGRGDMMISTLIEAQVSELLNWGFAASLSIILLIMTLILFYIYNRFFGLDRILGGTS